MKTTLDDQITPLQELRVLLCLIRHADGKGSVDFDNSDVTATLGGLVWNGNALDYLLHKLDEAGVIDYSDIGEDGFKPIILCIINDDTHRYVAALAENLEAEYVALDKRITDILTFSPSTLTSRIADTKRQIEEVKKHVASNDVLKSWPSHCARSKVTSIASVWYRRGTSISTKTSFALCKRKVGQASKRQ